jgi:uncharacterized tellurite resistance protein B-like protein
MFKVLFGSLFETKKQWEEKPVFCSGKMISMTISVPNNMSPDEQQKYIQHCSENWSLQQMSQKEQLEYLKRKNGF